MKRIGIIFTAAVFLLLLSSCNRNIKPADSLSNVGNDRSPETVEPTAAPTPTLTKVPSPAPTKVPTPKPTKKPAPTPTKAPSQKGIYDVKVDISDQMVYVYRGNKLIKTFICSTGIEGDKDTETPIGTYKIRHRGTWFFSQKYQQGAKYWVGFIGTTYLFHSLAMDKNQKVIPEEAAKLGAPASHGCVRLKVEEAKWFYDYVRDGSKVVIQK